MMKRYLLNGLLGLALLPAYGQGITDYYRLPDRSQQYNRLLSRYGGPYTRQRWYVALDGFVKTDRARLDNSFSGLLTSNRVTKANWGALVGWIYRERWAVEAEYAQMPIHTQVSVSNGSLPLTFRYDNRHSAFVLRGKRLLLSTSKPWLRSGFWLSGGVWVVPNNGRQEGNFSLVRYRNQGRWETPDTLRLISQTRTNHQMTAVAELGAEYNIRLSNAFDLGLYARKFWGLSNSITTDVTYEVNRTAVQQAQLQGNGTGMSYGLQLRYTFALRRVLPRALDVQGKTQRGKL